MFHTIVSIKNDGHYFCRAGGNRPDGLNEPVTANRCIFHLWSLQSEGALCIPYWAL
ncbi:copper resistance protein [Escherichia coli]|nr:copper resistance protein [Escherichia coli]